jgi:GrpB-like predicted nucleotidyltransferase (UPF0157 family)
LGRGSPPSLDAAFALGSYICRTYEPTFRLVNTGRAHERAWNLFEAVSKSLKAILPATADTRHIGATAIPGCLTKGDLDIVIRVPADNFDDADSILASRFARNHGSIRTEAFSAFEDPSTHPHLGVQLTTIDGPLDFFHLFVEALWQSLDSHLKCTIAVFLKGLDWRFEIEAFSRR